MKKVIPIVIVIVLIVAGIVGYYFIVREEPESESNEGSRYPDLDVRLTHTEKEDKLLIYHLGGYTFDLSKWKISIIPVKDTTKQAIITSLKGELTINDVIILSNITHTEMNDVNFIVGEKYYIDFMRNKDHGYIPFDDVVCEAGIEK